LQSERDTLLVDYERTNSIARAIAYAIEQEADVDIDEFVVRRTAQDF
jgi:NADP-dependent 3-hydroxy acid dehydrogenase YdfG